jgi:hypothetical protein
MTVGTLPADGMELIEGKYVKGIAAGENFTAVSGLTAHAGGTQAAGLAIPPGNYLVEFDTVANAADSAVLPFADQIGTVIGVVNSTASNAISVYSNPGTNPVTGTADTLNGSTSAAVSVAAHVVTWFVCAKLGVWIGS